MSAFNDVQMDFHRMSLNNLVVKDQFIQTLLTFY